MARPIATPLKAGAWDKALAGHPNPEWVATLVTGMRQGFRIGIQETPACRASLSNTPSAQEHKVVADQYIHIAFSSVEDAAHLMHYLGPSTLLAKMDVSEAYRLLPIHPEDRIFLGIK